MIRPLGDRVVVKALPLEDRTKGGIVLPDTVKEKPQKGEIVAVGSGRLLDSGQRVAIDLKPGDQVLYSKYAGNEVKIDDVDYLILRETDVLGVLE
ncbi:MAG: co-chaperone GroES [Eubacteriales bacterium]|nr:co-chaperone GroES [Bacillota bacterium]MBV1728042.1 co-chaperone GroES [Desulforudis sp.]MDP3049982.1 co-chaperone GroES [Eubacteriales bacterium]MDQ7788720.1 co-chaperone GroES [Clostridia bacterium]MBU4532480.1 co-chaperone GroES [Bacillota bacterium]